MRHGFGGRARRSHHPSIVVLSNGLLAMVFQANDGYLWTWTGAAAAAGNGTVAGYSEVTGNRRARAGDALTPRT